VPGTRTIVSRVRSASKSGVYRRPKKWVPIFRVRTPVLHALKGRPKLRRAARRSFETPGGDNRLTLLVQQTPGWSGVGRTRLGCQVGYRPPRGRDCTLAGPSS
jgi:hypothetical protein